MAKRFRFNLETVLKVRRRNEDEHKRIVANQLREVTRSQNRIRSINDQIKLGYRQAQQTQRQPQLDVSTMSRQRFWISHLQNDVLDAELALYKQEQQLEKERAALAEASKAVKVLEKLRERAFERYRKEQDRQERLEADEVALQQYIISRKQVEPL